MRRQPGFYLDSATPPLAHTFSFSGGNYLTITCDIKKR